MRTKPHSNMSVLAASMMGVANLATAWSIRAQATWPGKEWEARPAAQFHLLDSRLDAFVSRVKGDGCIIKDGYLIRAWGDYKSHGDWASAAKPVLGTLLMLAVVDGKLAGVDAQVAEAGWPLQSPDREMTFRHLADMVSGYARVEGPGAAWAYNDYAINLYALSLRRVLGSSLDHALQARLSVLQFQDGPLFGTRGGYGLNATPRDVARIGWFWLNRGSWRGRPVIPRKQFDACVRPNVPARLPRSRAEAKDYLRVGTYGGDSDQTQFGPGIYGFNFWFNERLPGSKHRVWPSLPRDCFQANGMWNRHTITVIPTWKMVVVVRDGNLGPFEPGVSNSQSDRAFQLLGQARSSRLLGPNK